MPEELKQKYDQWNNKKQVIQFDENNKTQQLYFREGDVWWCSLGLNVGKESYGKGDTFRRPVLVFKKLSADLCIAIPLSSQEKSGSWFIDIELLDKKSWALLHQMRTLDKRRFQWKIGKIHHADFARVKEKLESLLKLSF